MHGIRKSTEPRTAAEEARRVLLISQYTQLSSEYLPRHQKREYSPALLHLNTQLLTLTPDFQLCWNYRKDYYTSLQVTDDDDDDDNKISSCSAKDDLKLTATLLQKNPKSYAIWFHRQWCLSGVTDDEIYHKELKLCTQFLNIGTSKKKKH